MLVEPPILRRERRLDHMIRDLFERHGIVEIDAPLPDLVAVRIEELDAVLARRQPTSFLNLEKGGQRETVHDDQPTGGKRYALRRRFVQQTPPTGEPKARKEARSCVIAVLDPLPSLGQSRIEPSVYGKPVDLPLAAALPEEPVVHAECPAVRRD